MTSLTRIDLPARFYNWRTIPPFGVRWERRARPKSNDCVMAHRGPPTWYGFGGPHGKRVPQERSPGILPVTISGPARMSSQLTFKGVKPDD